MIIKIMWALHHEISYTHLLDWNNQKVHFLALGLIYEAPYPHFSTFNSIQTTLYFFKLNYEFNPIKTLSI